METIIFKTSIDTENRTMTDNYEVREAIDKETISAVLKELELSLGLK